MKHTRRIGITVLCLTCLSAVVFFSPFLVNIASFRNEFVTPLIEKLGVDIEIGDAKWHWFPLPHLVLFETVYSKENLHATVEEITLYPDIFSLFQNTFALRKITVHKPDIRLQRDALQRRATTKSYPSFIICPRILVRKGHILLQSDATNALSGEKTQISPEFSDLDVDYFYDASGTSVTVRGTSQMIHEIAGKIEWTTPEDTHESERGNSWKINFNAMQLDITAIRKAILTVFPHSGVALKVCNIVKGGRAKTAAFSASGSLNQLKKLENMVIAVDTDAVAIDIPRIGLRLRDGYGPIVIKDGLLSGKNLQCRIGNSIGTNGVISISLLKTNRQFMVDADVDADMRDLPGVLLNVVGNELFQAELKQFRPEKGRALGHLRLGDTYDNIVTDIDITESDAQVYYERQGYPVTMTKGRLTIKRGEVYWDGISGKAGPHTIHMSQGIVTWGEGIQIDIARQDATLDAAVFLGELTKFPNLKKAISRVLTSVSGNIEVTDFQLKGWVKNVTQWAYSAHVAASDVTFLSPFFGAPVEVVSARLQMDHDNIRILQSVARFLDSRLTMQGDFRHTVFQKWHGQMELDGKVLPDVGKWVARKDWIPPTYFPRVPCLLSPLTILFYKDKRIDLNGRIQTDGDESPPVEVLIELRLLADKLVIPHIDIITKEDRFHFTLEKEKRTKGYVAVSFEGNLKSSTVDQVLAKNSVLMGGVQGDFSVVYHPDAPNISHINGSMILEGFKWRIPENTIFVEFAQVTGNKAHAQIEQMTARLNKENVNVSGNMNMKKTGVDLDLNVSSKQVSWQNVTRLIKTLKPKEIATAETANKDIPQTGQKRYALSGKVRFSVDEFRYPVKVKKETKTTKKFRDYIWKGLKGVVTFFPEKTVIPITSGEICDFETIGTLRIEPDDTRFIFTIRPKRRVSFKKVFACIGSSFNKIEGSFHMNANLEGTPEYWKKGVVEFRSKKGRIKESSILASILSVINITDLFSNEMREELFTKGFYYSDMSFKGYIRNNILTVENAKIKGQGLNLFGKGRYDLSKKEFDFLILVAPFKIIDSAVSTLLSLGFAKGTEDNTILAIPVQVKGTLAKYKITVLPSQAVGQGLLNFMKNTLSLPFRIFSP